MVDGFRADGRIAGTVGQEQTVVVHFGEIVVPRHPHDLDVPGNQAAEDVVLDAAIDQDDPLGALSVPDDLLAADGLDQVVLNTIGLFGAAVDDNPSRHHALLPNHPGESPGVDAGDARHLLPLEPVAQALHGVPVAVVLTVIGNHEPADVNPLRLGMQHQAVRAGAHVGNPVIAYEGIAHAEDLPLKRRVRQTFGVPHHRSGENDLAVRRTVIAETPALQGLAVSQFQSCFLTLHLLVSDQGSTALQQGRTVTDPDFGRALVEGVEGLVQFGNHPVGDDTALLQGCI